jgi:hypothetical protein
VKFRTISIFLISMTASAGIIYVDDDATGANTGTSWTDAYVNLQDALVDANAVEKPVAIHVAQGVYKPDRGANEVSGDRGATFLLINGVTLRGGYAGLGQATPDVRNVMEFETVLHGDLQGDDGPAFAHYGNNSQVVVRSEFNDDTAVLDGFTITGGLGWSGPGISCYDSNALFTHCAITQNKSIGREGGWGGGMYISGGAPTLTHCSFEDNWALAEGGGIWCQSHCRPMLTRCLFRGNVAVVGGGLSAGQCLPILRNCVFENNEARHGAGLASHYRSHALLTNCSFYGNRAQDGTSLYLGQESIATVRNCILWSGTPEIMSMDNSRTDVTYSNIQGAWPGQGNADLEPLFVLPGHWIHEHDPNLAVDPNDPNAVWVNGDYHLKSQAGRWDAAEESWVIDSVSSPCIDTGDPNTPMSLEPFPNGGIVNLGAYGGTVEASKSPLDLASGTSQYEFLSEQSTLTQTGGFAGVHWVHTIEGHFVIEIDVSARTASFSQVEATAIDPDNPSHVLDPNTALNMTQLTGIIGQDGSIRFTGKADNETTVNLEMTLKNDLAHLTGGTTPPPGSADFFILNLDAMAQKQ